ncbi:protein takeout [Culex quinquefasciatus]|uniref:protein takeout n=1 Tax=Culex quinquefasciatus TaxID=7176 RepID=UPI0018E2F78A|nr:protein takeout [Culex quinquefasciatus]
MKFCVIGFVIILNFAISFAKLAPVLRACSTSDPQYEKCVRGVIESIRPNIISGNFGEGHPKAPPLEPFSIPKLNIEHGASFRVKLTNTVIRGLGGFVLGRVRFSTEDRVINITLKEPTISLKGQYDLNMKVAIMDVYGKGDLAVNLNNTIVNLQLSYDIGKDQTIQVRAIVVKLRFDKVRVQLKNLFDGDKAMGKMANDVVNKNPDMLLNEVGPELEGFLGKLFTEIANTVIGGATVQELLPP